MRISAIDSSPARQRLSTCVFLSFQDTLRSLLLLDVPPYIGMELVPVRRFPRHSRSIHFGDVSESNGHKTHFCLDHLTRNALVGQGNEALGLGKSFFTYADA